MKKRIIYTIATTYPKRAIIIMVAFAKRAMLPGYAIAVLAILWYGLWQIYPPVSWIVIGSLLWIDLALLKRKE